MLIPVINFIEAYGTSNCIMLKTNSFFFIGAVSISFGWNFIVYKTHFQISSHMSVKQVRQGILMYLHFATDNTDFIRSTDLCKDEPMLSDPKPEESVLLQLELKLSTINLAGSMCPGIRAEHRYTVAGTEPLKVEGLVPNWPFCKDPRGKRKANHHKQSTMSTRHTAVELA